ncbi:hypothetical protein BDV95DRAFT_453386, partial [Massariosphaeria phaeospora]
IELDDDPAVVEAYIQYLYTRQVAFPSVAHDNWTYLASLYVLGEKFIDISFKNAVIDTMLDYHEERSSFPPYKAVKIIYEGTPLFSPARKLVLDMYAWRWNKIW